MPTNFKVSDGMKAAIVLALTLLGLSYTFTNNYSPEQAYCDTLTSCMDSKNQSCISTLVENTNITHGNCVQIVKSLASSSALSLVSTLQSSQRSSSAISSVVSSYDSRHPASTLKNWEDIFIKEKRNLSIIYEGGV
jgi:hypothetical protein